MVDQNGGRHLRSLTGLECAVESEQWLGSAVFSSDAPPRPEMGTAVLISTGEKHSTGPDFSRRRYIPPCRYQGGPDNRPNTRRGALPPRIRRIGASANARRCAAPVLFRISTASLGRNSGLEVFQRYSRQQCCEYRKRPAAHSPSKLPLRDAHFEHGRKTLCSCKVYCYLPRFASLIVNRGSGIFSPSDFGRLRTEGRETCLLPEPFSVYSVSDRSKTPCGMERKDECPRRNTPKI